MTIRKHTAWGSDGVLPADGVVIRSDREGAEVVARARAAGLEPPVLGLVGGDLCATLGAPSDPERLYRAGARRYPIDLGVAIADGVEHLFLAHVLVRRPFWRGRIVAAMNAQYLDRWDLAPKGHPNDGRLDISDASLSWSDKLAARKRAPTGTHVPHPGIEVRRTGERTCDFDPPARLFIDGVPTGTVEHLELRVEPDALTIVVGGAGVAPAAS